MKTIDDIIKKSFAELSKTKPFNHNNINRKNLSIQEATAFIHDLRYLIVNKYIQKNITAGTVTDITSKISYYKLSELFKDNLSLRDLSKVQYLSTRLDASELCKIFVEYQLDYLNKYNQEINKLRSIEFFINFLEFYTSTDFENHHSVGLYYSTGLCSMIKLLHESEIIGDPLYNELYSIIQFGKKLYNNYGHWFVAGKEGWIKRLTLLKEDLIPKYQNIQKYRSKIISDTQFEHLEFYKNLGY